jgi:Transposase C of IS166 homeodomain
LRRAQFGRRSERIGEDQIELALEDVETQHGTEDAAAEKTGDIIRTLSIR